MPWALLPSLRDRVLSVAPSARAWLRTRTAVPPDRRDLVLVRGPGLGQAGSELSVLAAGSGGAILNGHATAGDGSAADGAIVLADGTATAAGVLAAIDGAWLAHIAAHGTFRADSPLFSSLRMDDGPLTVHDFERLRRAPYRLVLPCCDSGLLAAGRRGRTARPHQHPRRRWAPPGSWPAVVPVNDQAAARMMIRLHRALRDGRTLSEALRDARRDSGTDPVQVATGLSFIALGAG